MGTKVIDQKNIEDVVNQNELGEISHFRLSPFLSKVYKLRGLNVGSVADVNDAEYSLNAGFLSRAAYLEKSINFSILGGGAESSKYSLVLNGLGGGATNLKESINIGGIAAIAENTNYSLNIGGITQVDECAENSLNIGVAALNKTLKSSMNIGILVGAVSEDAVSSLNAAVYTITKNLTDSFEIGIVNCTEENLDSNSFEIGIVNYARENLGYQIGLVNICRSRKGSIEGKEAKGKSIGLVNIDLDKPWYESVSLFYK